MGESSLRGRGCGEMTTKSYTGYPVSGLRWQARRDTAFHQGDKRRAALPEYPLRTPPRCARCPPQTKRCRASLALLLTRNVYLVIPAGAGNRCARLDSIGGTSKIAQTARRFPAPLPRCEFSISLPAPGVRGVPRPLSTFLASLQDAPARPAFTLGIRRCSRPPRRVQDEWSSRGTTGPTAPFQPQGKAGACLMLQM